jgi:sialic acid synthase SpsE
MTFIIAECGVNWRTLSEADEMIRQAAKAGANAVKFQAYNSEQAQIAGISQHLEKIRLMPVDIQYLYYRCQQHEIEFICTPFYLNAVVMLNPYVSRWKIRYKDRNNLDLIALCKNTGKDMLISADNNTSRFTNDCFKYLYCIPDYPPKTDWNIVNLVKGFGGFSCHFPNWKIPWYVCKQMDLDYLEVHVRLDKYEGGWCPPDQRVSISMKELRQLCKELK